LPAGVPRAYQGSVEPLARGDFPRLAYRLGRARATGVVTVAPPRQRPELLVLRRGHLITSEHDASGRAAALRLGRLAALDDATWAFDGGTAAYPPGAAGRQVALAAWARRHLEAQLDAARADRLVAELAGARIAIRPEQAPDPLDDTDRRLLIALAQPRRIDQLGPLARAPRYRLLSLLHFLHAVGALQVVAIGAGAPPPRRPAAPPADPRVTAMRLLGIDDREVSRETVKRAYRRLARALHPDLQPGISDGRRRELEAKLASVTAAYQSLL
jgi:hypothetical protein